MDLKKTISILYDMELNNFYMTNAELVLEEKIRSLGKKDARMGVKRKNIGEGEFEEKAPDRWAVPFVSIFFGCVALVFIGFGIYSAIMTIGEIFKEFEFFDIISFIPMTIVMFFAMAVRYGLIIGAIAGVVIDLLILIVREVAFHSKYSSFNNKLKAHRSKVAEEEKKDEARVEKELQKDNERVEKELLQKQILTKQYNLICSRRRNAQEFLSKLYKKSGIDPKFQNLVAIGYMNEFARLGVATRLEGVDGLYYLILKELRWDQMQHSLTTICNSLEKVIDNQRMMYGELVSMRQESKMMANRVINGINNLGWDIGELKRVAELTGERVGKGINSLNSNINGLKAIEEYNGRRIAKELEYQNYMIRYGV